MGYIIITVAISNVSRTPLFLPTSTRTQPDLLYRLCTASRTRSLDDNLTLPPRTEYSARCPPAAIKRLKRSAHCARRFFTHSLLPAVPVLIKGSACTSSSSPYPLFQIPLQTTPVHHQCTSSQRSPQKRNPACTCHHCRVLRDTRLIARASDRLDGNLTSRLHCLVSSNVRVSVCPFLLFLLVACVHRRE